MLYTIVDKMIKYTSPDVKRIHHALKVFSFSQLIAGMERCTEDTRTIICIAAILHDIGIHNAELKYNSSAGPYQEIEGPPVAHDLLVGFTIPAWMLERVLFLIGNHHSYQKIDNIDFQILVEADFIVNIAEDGMSKDAITSIKEKIFTTRYGISLMDALYP